VAGTSNIKPWEHVMISYRKVGGIRFVRIGTVCLSFCMTRKRNV